MQIDIMTLFPEMLIKITETSILKRAINKGIIKINFHQIRDYAQDKHKTVDDTTYGHGKGMLLKAEPIFLCFEDIIKKIRKKPHTIYMSPRGKLLDQKKVKKLKDFENLIILCGHYEGIDERIVEEIIDEEISIGDYVLTGGELPAMILVDAVCRLLPGTLSADECFIEESHYNGLLEYPQYTKPKVFKKKSVPDVLLSGNHKEIKKWQYKESIFKTFKERPDLLLKKIEDENLYRKIGRAKDKGI